MKKNTYVVLRITDNCNMSCSWCVAHASLVKKQNKELPIMSFQTLKDIVDNALSEGIHTYKIVGGEPLLYPDELKLFIEYICKQDPYAIITVFTNATLLTPDLAVFFNKYKNILIVFSVCLYGEKGFDNFLKRTIIKNSIISLINQIERKSIRNVILKGQPFALETVALHYIFDNCNIELALDDTVLPTLNFDDFTLLEEELSKIKRLCGNIEWLEILSVMTNRCSCTVRTGYRANGTPDYNYVYTRDEYYGCPAMIKLMGSKNYNRFFTVVQNYFPPQDNKEKNKCLL